MHNVRSIDVHNKADSAVIWVLAMMSPIPKDSIDLMSYFDTVPRAPITTGRMAVST